MEKPPKLPCLPGFNFNHDIGRTKFNKPQHFDRVHGDIYFLADKPNDSRTRYPALYAWGELPPLPPWITHDGQRLMFSGYFLQGGSEYGQKDPYSVRHVKISFFLEDGTIKISEPFIENSGLDQGLIVRRQRIPLPDPVKYRYYDILDLNIGKECEFFGRTYKITDCDPFTRKFLNRMGIPVPDPIEVPCDPLSERQKRERKSPPKNCYQDGNFGKFLKYDQQVLRFYGYWDDTESPFGYVHDLEVLYFLADDRMEVIERLPMNRWGPPKKELLVSRIKVPKFFEKLAPIGSSDPVTLLNVLGDNINSLDYYPDHAYHEGKPTEYYKDCDLAIGAQLNVFGRRVVLTSADQFTRDFYRKKYGIDDFTPLARPDRQECDDGRKTRYVPPYNGYGTYEDSLANCFSVVPKRPKVLADQYYTYENQDNNDQILRFGARMVDDTQDRYFIILVYVVDKNVAIVEKVSGKDVKALFLQKMPVRFPGQELFSSEPPKIYEPPHFYVGARVNLNGFKFEVDTADEYTFNYMESHPHEFPKANVELCMSKVRESLRPKYLDFTAKYAPSTLGKTPPSLSYDCFREAMLSYVDGLAEHEIITLARHYTACNFERQCPREFARTVVHGELVKQCWNELDRLQEDIYDWDKEKKGYLGADQVYTLLRANRLPVPTDLVHLVIDCLKKNAMGEVDCRDLVRFLDIKIDPVTPTIPKSIHEMHWRNKIVPKKYDEVDWNKFIKDLGLEKPLVYQN